MSDIELLFNAIFVYPNLNTRLPDYKEKQTKLRTELLNPKVTPFLHHNDFITSTVPEGDLVPEDEEQDDTNAE